MNALELRPLDVWTVRDGRPFDVGGVAHARAVWPPSPWTVLGAVRTSLCAALGVSPADYGESGRTDPEVTRAVELLGAADTAPTFELGPLLLAREGDEVCWPVPADVASFAQTGQASHVRLERLRALERAELRRAGFAISAHRVTVLLPPLSAGELERSDPPRWLRREQLEQWIAGEPLSPSTIDDGRTPLGSEARIGIEIDDASGAVREGRFYVRWAHALEEGYGLLVPVPKKGPAGIPWGALEGQCVRLGADGHLAAVRWLADRPLWPDCASDARRSGKAALLFLSPVSPDDLGELRAAGARVVVEAVAAGRPLAIGGWRLRHERGVQVGPRPLRRYYPAGTVAYVRSEGDLSLLHGTSVARDPEERAAGFGFCLVGARPV